MSMKLKKKFNLFASSEELISMFLGLVIVVVIAGLIFNFFQRHKGTTSVPGVTVSQDDNNAVDDNSNSSNPNEYIVKKGDNLWKIAVAQYGDGYKWTEIAKENKLTNPGQIDKGQKLILPQIEKKETIAASTDKTAITANNTTKISTDQTEYVVVKGDNLWKIAVARYNDGYKWTKIWQANKSLISNPSSIEIGMKLTLPMLN